MRVAMIRLTYDPGENFITADDFDIVTNLDLDESIGESVEIISDEDVK